MKTLIAYYSYSGNCGVVANALKDALNADVLELKPVDDRIRKGLVKYIWGGKQVLSHAKPPLKPYQADWEAYDRIIIGCPVWAGSPAPAIMTFLSETKITGKKIVLFCCHLGGRGKVFDTLKTMLEGNTFAGERDFVIRDDEGRRRAQDDAAVWAKTLA
ncbi:MAG: NAD(P)H-dependent oxidoreductase [Treponema sp.]|jgi:flavodoxin|nr:NAD(P)H-dependent oxidoreductase [Treponema sp.]